MLYVYRGVEARTKPEWLGDLWEGNVVQPRSMPPLHVLQHDAAQVRVDTSPGISAWSLPGSSCERSRPRSRLT